VPYNFKTDNFMNENKRKCPVCGKQFWSSSQWVYKSNYNKAQQIYCSWKCMRSEERKRMTISDKITQAIRDGLNDNEIKRLLGVTQRQIDFRRMRNDG